jgi:hypothetical protein
LYRLTINFLVLDCKCSLGKLRCQAPSAQAFRQCGKLFPANSTTMQHCTNAISAACGEEDCRICTSLKYLPPKPLQQPTSAKSSPLDYILNEDEVKRLDPSSNRFATGNLINALITECGTIHLPEFVAIIHSHNYVYNGSGTPMYVAVLHNLLNVF